MNYTIDYTNSATSAYYENGEQVYPCRCGETHRGPYALYDFGHHMCFHTETALAWLDEDADTLICIQCGQVFGVEEKRKTGA